MPWLCHPSHSILAMSPWKAAALRILLPFCLPQWLQGHVMRHALFSRTERSFGWHGNSQSNWFSDPDVHAAARRARVSLSLWRMDVVISEEMKLCVCVCLCDLRKCVSHKWETSRWTICLKCFLKMCLKSSIRFHMLKYLLCFSRRRSNTVAQVGNLFYNASWYSSHGFYSTCFKGGLGLEGDFLSRQNVWAVFTFLRSY